MTTWDMVDWDSVEEEVRTFALERVHHFVEAAKLASSHEELGDTTQDVGENLKVRLSAILVSGSVVMRGHPFKSSPKRREVEIE